MAIQYNPTALSLYRLGYALQMQGRIAEGMDVYRDVIETDPEYAVITFGLAHTFDDATERDEAMAVYRRGAKKYKNALRELAK